MLNFYDFNFLNFVKEIDIIEGSQKSRLSLKLLSSIRLFIVHESTCRNNITDFVGQTMFIK